MLLYDIVQSNGIDNAKHYLSITHRVGYGATVIVISRIRELCGSVDARAFDEHLKIIKHIPILQFVYRNNKFSNGSLRYGGLEDEPCPTG